MPDKGRGIAAWGRTTVSHLLAAAFGGIATLIAGLVVYHYTKEVPELVYETFPPTDFASETTQLSIYNARVENVGDKEAEDVQVRFELTHPRDLGDQVFGLAQPMAIDEFEVEPSLKSISFDVLPPVQPNVREVKFARLNPGESSRFSILSTRVRTSH